MQGSLRRSFTAFCVFVCANAGCAPAADPPATDPPAVRTITNSIGMKLVWIPAGQFEMGSVESAEQLAQPDRRPRRPLKTYGRG